MMLCSKWLEMTTEYSRNCTMRRRSKMTAGSVNIALCGAARRLTEALLPDMRALHLWAKGLSRDVAADGVTVNAGRCLDENADL